MIRTENDTWGKWGLQTKTIKGFDKKEGREKKGEGGRRCQIANYNYRRNRLRPGYRFALRWLGRYWTQQCQSFQRFNVYFVWSSRLVLIHRRTLRGRFWCPSLDCRGRLRRCLFLARRGQWHRLIYWAWVLSKHCQYLWGYQVTRRARNQEFPCSDVRLQLVEEVSWKNWVSAWCYKRTRVFGCRVTLNEWRFNPTTLRAFVRLALVLVLVLRQNTTLKEVEL